MTLCDLQSLVHWPIRPITKLNCPPVPQDKSSTELVYRNIIPYSTLYHHDTMCNVIHIICDV
jgi:hypothetical protein